MRAGERAAGLLYFHHGLVTAPQEAKQQLKGVKQKEDAKRKLEAVGLWWTL